MYVDYVFMIPIRLKGTEEFMKAYVTGIYSTFGGSKYILSDRGSEFTSKQFTFLTNEFGFIKVYTSLYTPTGNSVIEWTHSFLKVSLRKHFCNHQICWAEITHSTAMAYNAFPHSSAVEAQF